MKDKDEEIIETLIAGGFIGAMLGALMSKKPSKGEFLGAIAGAALLATFKANEKARNSDVSLFVEEDNILYEIQSDGTKRFVRKIEKSTKRLPENFKLE